MKEDARTPRWWSVFEAALGGLLCSAGRDSTIPPDAFVDEARGIADRALDLNPAPPLAQVRGAVRSIEGDHINPRRLNHVQVAIGDSTVSFKVPPDHGLSPGDVVVVTVWRDSEST
jgi:hypothetical protein